MGFLDSADSVVFVYEVIKGAEEKNCVDRRVRLRQGARISKLGSDRCVRGGLLDMKRYRIDDVNPIAESAQPCGINAGPAPHVENRRGRRWKRASEQFLRPCPLEGARRKPAGQSLNFLAAVVVIENSTIKFHACIIGRSRRPHVAQVTSGDHTGSTSSPPPRSTRGGRKKAPPWQDRTRHGRHWAHLLRATRGRMSRRGVWILITCVAVVAVAVAGLSVAGQGIDVFGIAMLTFPIVGAFIVVRQPRNATGWILIGIGAFMGASALLNAYADLSLNREYASLPGGSVALALDQHLWVPVVGLPGTFLILLFPDGRLPTPRWRPWGYFCAFALTLCYVTLTALPGVIDTPGYPSVRNPLGIAELGDISGPLVAGTTLLIPIAMIGCAVALVRRFHRARGLARVQLKWLAAAAGVAAAAYLLLIALNVPFAITGGESPQWLDVAGSIGIFAFVLIPIAIGLAIFRHRLYDIDVIINRTLVYGVLTASLTATYLVAVTGLQGLLRPIAGDSQLAVAGSTLFVAAIFGPLRRSIQRFVDRRFYRSKFDAQSTLENFSARLRDEVDLETLTGDLLAVVDRTVKPAMSSVWLRPDGFAGSGEATAPRPLPTDRPST